MSPKPWGEAYDPPGPIDFLAWFRQQSTEAQIYVMDSILMNAAQGRRCFHDKHLDDIEALDALKDAILEAQAENAP